MNLPIDLFDVILSVILFGVGYTLFSSLFDDKKENNTIVSDSSKAKIFEPPKSTFGANDEKDEKSEKMDKLIKEIKDL